MELRRLSDKRPNFFVFLQEKDTDFVCLHGAQNWQNERLTDSYFVIVETMDSKLFCSKNLRKN